MAPQHFTLAPRTDVLTDRQMNWLHAAHSPSLRQPCRPQERDLLSDQDATVLFHAFYDGAVSPNDRESPEWAVAVGLIEAGLRIPAEAGAAALADNLR
ncbi:hypothetical protein ACFWWT_46195 [Streptomyces sp. NPDC058676]|uniref:hypothetical protein n=1 Tax=unclassified Streptomyces TaxID=2593676 RepID=UPI0036471798